MNDGRNFLERVGVTEEDEPPTCQWFLLCDNQASRTVNHPILGEVPACERCITNLGLTPTQPERSQP